MKKTNNINRAIALVLVAVMMLSTLIGCHNSDAYQEYGEKIGITSGDSVKQENDKDSSAEIKNLEDRVDSLDEKLNQILELVQNSQPQQPNTEATNEPSSNVNSENQQQSATDEGSKELEAVKAEAQALQEEKTALEKEKAALLAEVEALKAKLGNETDPFVRDENGVPVSIDLVDAEKLLRVEMADGTYAYRMGTGTQIDVTDTIVLTSNKPYAETTFTLAHHKSDIYLVTGVDANGNTRVLHMVYGNKLYSYNSAWAQPKKGYGFPLNENTKKVFHGSDIALSFADAICVYEDANSPWGYSLCLAYTDNEYVKKPAAPKPEDNGCHHGDGCHCGDCDKCPKLETETIVKTETVKVCMICGAKDCKGHVETKVETEIIKVCMICGAKDCKGHVETKVETETIKVCMICGAKDCNGHVDTEYRCGRCGNHMNNCTCSYPSHNDRPTDNETPDHNDRPGESGTTTPPEEDSTKNPEGDGTVVETPDHNDRPGESGSGTTTPPEEDSTKNPEGDGTVVETPEHSERPVDSETPEEGEDSTGNTEGDGTVVETPGHSPRP